MLAALRASRRAPTRVLISTRTPTLSNPTLRRWKQTTAESHDSSSPVASQDGASEDTQQEAPPNLMYLSRPLGVDKRPSTTPRSWEEKKAELLDYDKHIEKRRHLVKEATKGYFQDFHALKHHGGKTWIAPSVLIREDKALYYPDVTGVSLSPQETVHTTSMLKGRISLVSMLSTTMSEEHAKSFNAVALGTHESNPLFQFVQINLQENPLKGFLVSMFLTSIRTRTPAHLQPTYLVSRQNMEYLREPLGMINKHIGYVYLVDENCKIRWAGCGFAEPEEATALQNCTRVLLQRLDKTSTSETPAGSGSSGTDSPSLSSPE